MFFNKNNLLKDEKAILNPILSCLISLFIVVLMYYIFMPLQFYIGNTLIAMGAPASPILFFYKMERWGFYIFALTALVILLAKVYKKTRDTGREPAFFD